MSSEAKRGRPPRIIGELASARIWGYLTPTERQALKLVARASGQTLGHLIREAVNEYVADFSEKHIF